MKKTISAIILFVILFLPDVNQVIAEEPSRAYTPYFPNYPPLTLQEMMAFARKGAEYLENGGDVQEFNKNPGKFTKGVFLDYRYLAVADCKIGTVLAHPFIPRIVNVKGLMFKVKDARGRAYSSETCSAALSNPKGAWSVAFIKKPGEQEIDLLYQYNVRVKNTDMVVGVFSRNLKLEEHLDKRAGEEEQILNSLVK